MTDFVNFSSVRPTPGLSQAHPTWGAVRITVVYECVNIISISRTAMFSFHVHLMYTLTTTHVHTNVLERAHNSVRTTIRPSMHAPMIMSMYVAMHVCVCITLGTGRGGEEEAEEGRGAGNIR